MKKQIITLIIGILIGAVITAAVFLIFKPKNSKNAPDFSQFNKDGEKFNPEEGDFDMSNFNPGEGRSRRNKDDSEKDSTTEEKETEDKQNENQG